MRLTKRIRSGLLEMAGICDTILDAGGEGWALECRKGEDNGQCNRPDCEECQAFAEVSDACAWLRQFVRKKEAVKS